MRAEEEAAVKGKKKGKLEGGKNSIMNGRALFQYNPDLFKEAEETDLG